MPTIIERFLRTFPREQVHILLSEDLKARPTETTRAVYEFLDVDPGLHAVVQGL